MFVPFNTLLPKSKIWIYQSNKTFSDDEVSKIKTLLEPFVEIWQYHGQDLKASFNILYNQFIVLAVSEDDTVSGCTIDASVHTIQQIEREFNVDLTNKMQTAFKNGDNINTVSLADFKKYVGLNKITEDTIVFNNMVNTIEALQTKWEVPAKLSWHKRYFK
ncbi:MAG: ABC transporter ATPase [Flavobacteriaceae bacterium]